MKLVLASVLSVVLIVSNANSVDGDVQCGNNKFCPVGFKPFRSPQPSNEYQLLRRSALRVASITRGKLVGILSSRLDEWMINLNDFCYDDTIGFILDENVFDYVVSCVWTGASQFGQCQAVPEKYSKKPYYYVDPEEWYHKLTTVRNALGCNGLIRKDSDSRKSNATTKPSAKNYSNPYHRRSHFNPHLNRFDLREKSELFICNERCIQGGISYIAMVIVILTLAVSFMKNCLEMHD
ncbi:hypothetical protein CRE_22531 [Caenorhabditis remanei]|uniref:Uncharacterized protein n=1 Tax=Caenorhabditis remanei TaxID=31234 RepID=E3MU02_CAERE|nr:hypothetical protein CRE_22531 [Caenorhabditis remanei]